jgi:carbon-monoxide dehydrogenase medium subunit
MYETIYARADSVSDAASKMGSAGDGKYISGGMTLLPTMKQRLAAPDALIDLTSIGDMGGVDSSGRSVKIGALATHNEVNSSSALRSACPALADLAGWIGDPAVRYRGTIGGSIANNDPAADYPSAMLALGATIHTNSREISADDFFTGMFETALSDEEIVTGISFNAPEKCSYEKFRNPASRYAMAGVFVAKHADGVRVGVTGASQGGAYRWTEAEDALNANWSPDALDGLAVDEGDMLSDIHATAAYRANLVKVMAKRAVAGAK